MFVGKAELLEKKIIPHQLFRKKKIAFSVTQSLSHPQSWKVSTSTFQSTLHSKYLYRFCTLSLIINVRKFFFLTVTVLLRYTVRQYFDNV